LVSSLAVAVNTGSFVHVLSEQDGRTLFIKPYKRYTGNIVVLILS